MLSLEHTKALSSLFSVISTSCWVIALLPQQIQNFRTKSVSGLSPQFLFLWMTGDTLSVIGCVMTHQLPFQLYISCYFLLNDIILNLQYLWYHNNDKKGSEGLDGMIQYIEGQPAYGSTSHPSSPKALAATLATVISAGVADAAPIGGGISTASGTVNVGKIVAWSCTTLYIFSRMPQLYKNYRRKSVEGISPLLFTFAVIANLAYTSSILTSWQLVYGGPNRAKFVLDELPYMIGSSGTVVFDLFYFYQRWYYGMNKSYVIVDDES